ncbi:MAG: rane protein [Bacillales bacterium]|jgi:YggT family protein|nr:rane protein [Bacillales bacterium]
MSFLFDILSNILSIYMYALIIYILMSWFPQARDTAFGKLLSKICEPYLDPFRRFIPPLGMFDISPIVAIYALQLAQHGLKQVFIMLT